MDGGTINHRDEKESGWTKEMPRLRPYGERRVRERFQCKERNEDEVRLLRYWRRVLGSFRELERWGRSPEVWWLPEIDVVG
jgi:hypothetical protein